MSIGIKMAAFVGVCFGVGCGGGEGKAKAPEGEAAPTATSEADTAAAPSAAPPAEPAAEPAKGVTVSIPATADARKAVAEGIDACKAEELQVFDCIDAASKTLESGGGAKKVEEALTVFHYICVDMEVPPACYNGVRAFTENVVAWDADMFYPFALGACAAGTETECVEHGDRFRDGRDVPADPAKAQEIYRKGCELLSHQPACERLK